MKFTEYKDKIIKALEDRAELKGEWTLIEAFINSPIQPELSGNVVIGGPSLPLVAVASKTSGEVRLFALRALLPEEKI